MPTPMPTPMPVRIACSLSLLCFAICVTAGTFGADNPFGTVVWRALTAMACTFALGLIVGKMAATMIEENIAAEAQRLAESARSPATPARKKSVECRAAPRATAAPRR